MTDADRKLDSGETMAEMWEGFATKVLPTVDRGSVQYRETEAAFYAGALCLFNWFMVQLDDEAEPTPADLARVDAMDAEINGYFYRVMGRMI